MKNIIVIDKMVIYDSMFKNIADESFYEVATEWCVDFDHDTWSKELCAVADAENMQNWVDVWNAKIDAMCKHMKNKGCVVVYNDIIKE